MKIIELTKEQEEKWLSDIKEDRIEFIHRLHRNLTLRDGKFKLRLSNELIKELFFMCHETYDDNNEYKVDYYELIRDGSIKDDDLSYIFSILDLNDFKLENIKLNQKYLNIIKDCNMILDLDNVYSNDLSYFIIKETKIKGSFDNFKIRYTEIINNSDIFGNKIKINPQKFLNKSLICCKIVGVEFTDNFDNCYIQGITLKDNNNTVITPHNLNNKDLSSATIKDAKFIGSLDDCKIKGLELENVENAYLHISFFQNITFQNFNNIKIYITNDDEFKIFKNVLDKHPSNRYAGATIVCSLKHRGEIESYLSNGSTEVKYETLESSFDNDIASVFNNINNNSTLDSIPKNNIKESNPVKEKKKSIFGRFKRR